MKANPVRGKVQDVGSIPTASTTFPVENEGSVSTERKLNSSSELEGLIPPIKPLPKKAHPCELGRLSEPYLVKHGHLVARIVYAPSDGLYHAYFSVGGKRVPKAA